jgi:hypothetical protein
MLKDIYDINKKEIEAQLVEQIFSLTKKGTDDVESEIKKLFCKARSHGIKDILLIGTKNLCGGRNVYLTLRQTDENGKEV